MRAPGLGNKPIRVLIADDQPTARQGLKIKLSLDPNVTIVGEARDGGEAVSLAKILCPDVILMDVEMPGMDGIEATKALRAVTPQSAVVILTLYDTAATQARAQEAGAAAFVAKHQANEKLLAAIRRVTGTVGRSP